MRGRQRQSKMLPRLYARSCELFLKAWICQHVAEHDVSDITACLDVTRIMNPANEAVVSVVVGSLQDLLSLLRHHLHQRERKQIARERVATGIRVRLFTEFADWVKVAVELEWAWTMEGTLQRLA